MSATTEFNNPRTQMSAEQLEMIGREFQEIHDEVFSELGARDAEYIRAMVQFHRRLSAASRAVLIVSRFWPAWMLGTTGLSVAKIIENMELGHNIMHGQWDWMNDPNIHSSVWDWDNTSPGAGWKHSHNYLHHTFTNVVGKDKDVGYEVMRIDPKQPWHPVYALQPVYNLLIAGLFEWAVAFHDLDIEGIFKRTADPARLREDLARIGVKSSRQVLKDYIAWPAISGLVMLGIEVFGIAAFDHPARSRNRRLVRRARHGAVRSLQRTRAGAALGRRRERSLESEVVELLRGHDEPERGIEIGDVRRVLAWLVERRAFREPFRATLTANVVANLVRNVWAYAIIMCNHFPDQTYTFTEAEIENETRGEWYVRQLLGAANLEGSPVFHLMAGNLSFQVEHHLFPDMPSSRYVEIAPRVREICERYELPYNIGPLTKQFLSVQRTIVRLAFPGGVPRPKPGPHREPIAAVEVVPAREAIAAFP